MSEGDVKEIRRHRTFFQWCRRYISLSTVGVIGALVYVMFFTDKSAGDTFRYTREAEHLRVQLKAAEDSLAYYKRLNENVYQSPEAMERVVREHFHMQKENEDVYQTIEQETK